MKSLVICEKPSQARSIRAAVGSRFGEVLPAVGHIVTLQEPDEIKPEWAGAWKAGLLWNGTFYPKKVVPQTKQYFDAIRIAARDVQQIVIATDCDREGQLIGQEIVDHIGFKGRVLRAIFNAEDPKSLRDAFDTLKPNDDFRGLYDAGRAREQADQASNLSLTRTATVVLKAPGTKGAIGIGRVKSPVLGIICQREEEIQNFQPQDYFQILANTKVAAGALTLICGSLPKSLVKEEEGQPESEESEELDENDAALEEMQPLRGKIMRRDLADALAQAVKGYRGPVAAKYERKKQGPPKLFDLTALQSTASAKFGWSGERTLEVAQKLYSERTLITYPRGEAKYLPETNIGDIPTLVGSLMSIGDYRGFRPLLEKPEVRRGKTGHFSDKALEGFSHYAIIPNVNTADSFSRLVPMLGDDERRLFDLIVRQYLAALSPDHEYRQTSLLMVFPWKGHDWSFTASGRVPLVAGWKAILGSTGSAKEKDEERELPEVKNGETGEVLTSSIKAVTTKPPARYTEGSLIRVMQEAWRLVPPGRMRERLKEAKGIGTPATRGDIVKNLKGQGQIVEKGKSIHPTSGGMDLWRVLKKSCPNVVDPGRTALWETLFDTVEKKASTPEAVVNRILEETKKEIEAITTCDVERIAIGKANAPTAKMKDFAQSLADRKKIKLPPGTLTNAAKCQAFLNEHAGPPRARGDDASPGAAQAGPRAPSDKQLAFATSIADRNRATIPDDVLADGRLLSAWIDKNKNRLKVSG